MAKTSDQRADSGQALNRKLRKTPIKGGVWRGALYGDLSEPEIAKCAKGYKGDPRFLQYCRQYMASKLLEEPKPCDALPSTSLTANPWLAQLMVRMSAFGRWLKTCQKRRLFAAVLICLFLFSRPAFSTLCGKVSVLLIKTFIKKTFAVFTLILDAILEEAVSQLDYALLPNPVELGPQSTPREIIDKNGGSLQIALHLICILIGSLLQRAYGVAPTPARNSPN